jgi:hypothetical protein
MERLTNSPIPMPPPLGFESHSSILHSQAHTIAIALGFDQQLPRSIFDAAHCIRSVLQQIQDDLLELHTIRSPNI